MSEQLLEIFQTRLRIISSRIEKYADEEYLRIPSEFTPLGKNLFGKYTFGYGECGDMYINNGEVQFSFELLSSKQVKHISITIHLVLKVFNSIFVDEEDKLPDCLQFIQIDTACVNDIHGHDIGGWISPELGAWLKKQGGSVSNGDSFSRVYLPEVGEVMRQTWNTIESGELKEDANECRAMIVHDGRFSLTCPGNACDVSIYPDQLYGDDMGTHSVRFGCHNLDAAVQQITLLAGIAKLCEFARNDE